MHVLGKLYLKEGEHVYPFSVSLPYNLPSTFEEEYGRIQYTAKVVINIPWDIKKGKEIAFEVISELNLNDEPSLAVSIGYNIFNIISLKCVIHQFNCDINLKSI